MIKKLTPIIAILTIAGLITYALHLGINGVILAGGVAVIAALGGYVAPHKKPPSAT